MAKFKAIVVEKADKGQTVSLTEFDEASLFADLEPEERRQIEARILDGLQQLTRDALTLRLPIVYARGTNPG